MPPSNTIKQSVLKSNKKIRSGVSKERMITLLVETIFKGYSGFDEETNCSASKLSTISPPCCLNILPKCRATNPQSTMPVWGEWMALKPYIPFAHNTIVTHVLMICHKYKSQRAFLFCMWCLPHSWALSSWSRCRRSASSRARCSWDHARTAHPAVCSAPRWQPRLASSNQSMSFISCVIVQNQTDCV